MTEATGRRRPGTPCWAGLMTHRAQEARDFYGALFGWEFEPGPGGLGGYAFAVLDGRRVAGIGQAPADPYRPVAWTTVLAADDVDQAAEAVHACGGTVGVGPLSTGDEGRLAMAADPAGAVFGIWQSERLAGADLAGVPGAVAWSELWTAETALIAKFYEVVFGLDAERSRGGEPDRVVLTAGRRPVAGVRGMGSRLPRDRGAHWLTYFATDDPDRTVTRATALGARVVDPPGDSRYGRMATLIDPEGAAFALIAPAHASA